MERFTSLSDAPMRLLGGMPAARRLLEKLHVRKEWEAANPEIAALMNEAFAEDDARTKAAELAERYQEAAKGAPLSLPRLGVPRVVLRALRTPQAKPALSAAKEWWLSGKVLLLLQGGVGSGKTTAAAWVLAKQLERESASARPSGGTVVDAAMFVTAPEFNGLSDYHPESRVWLERLCRCGVLVLDDLGTERMGDGELSCVQRLISERHSAGRRTVLTSNLTAEVFHARYGERVADRIRESGMVRGSGKESLRRAAP